MPGARYLVLPDKTEGDVDPHEVAGGCLQLFCQYAGTENMPGFSGAGIGAGSNNTENRLIMAVSAFVVQLWL